MACVRPGTLRARLHRHLQSKHLADIATIADVKHYDLVRHLDRHHPIVACDAGNRALPLLGFLHLALDAPSGLDTATGEVFDPTINAAATLTLALPKRGLRSRREKVGELYLADISVPPALYEHALGLEVGPLFAESDVVRLD